MNKEPGPWEVSATQVMTENITNEINRRILANTMRQMYYNGCKQMGMMKEWYKYVKFNQWEHREEEYREKLYIGNDGNVKMYHTEYSWKPSKFLLNVRLLVDKAMQVYVGILENRLVKFDPEDYH